MNTLSPEALYGALVIGLFIVPRFLQRFRLPAAIVAVGLGALAGIVFGAFVHDTTIQLFSTLGITALFLFAGLEVDFHELRPGIGVLLQHIAIQLLLVAIGTWVCGMVFDLTPRASVLFALAILTPSTGFILDSLPSFGLRERERFWVKSKAIATEMVALTILFVAIQSTSLYTFGISTIAMAAMVILLPPIFHVFQRFIAPYAPNTEFTFLVLVALICAYVTRTLGVYYLVGAFVVGLSAVRMRYEIPTLTSEKLLGSVELFASFFIPFYFFKAGTTFELQYFTPRAYLIAALLVAILVPLKVAVVAVHRRIVLDEAFSRGARIGVSMVPTLVFTIVIADILRARFALPGELYGALILFTVINTAIPGFVLHAPPPAFEAPTIPRETPSTGIATV
jgi:Kef-type K+ transport system membrane component KefB